MSNKPSSSISNLFNSFEALDKIEDKVPAKISMPGVKEDAPETKKKENKNKTVPAQKKHETEKKEVHKAEKPAKKETPISLGRNRKYENGHKAYTLYLSEEEGAMVDAIIWGRRTKISYYVRELIQKDISKNKSEYEEYKKMMDRLS